jgi:hypothetical protein
MLTAKRAKKADDRAQRATLQAEQMFDEAERSFSADMARDAARKALESYDLREAAIRESEAAIERCEDACRSRNHPQRADSSRS